MEIILHLLSIVGAFVVVIGIASVIGYVDQKKWIKHNWQIGLVSLIIALSVVALASLIK
jgi:uncharacterized membrane protein HdeD (DUF308 family)